MNIGTRVKSDTLGIGSIVEQVGHNEYRVKFDKLPYNNYRYTLTEGILRSRFTFKANHNLTIIN